MSWKIVSAVLAAVSVVLLVLLVRGTPMSKLSDPRLIGTWISDRERTLENLRTQWQPSEERHSDLSDLLGRLKVTYTDATVTTELDDFVQTGPYTVVGVDNYSVVIRDDSPPDPAMEMAELSTFSCINFDGDDTYWVTSGGFTEYFTRVSSR